MNWGLYQLWRSGALCIEATTRLDQLLSTGLFSLFVRSLDDLSFPAKEVALSRDDVMEMQRILTRLGHDTDGTDGVVGRINREEGQGSTFTVHLPLADHPPQQEGA